MRNRFVKGFVFAVVFGIVFFFLSADLLAAEPGGFTAEDIQIPLDALENLEIGYPGGSSYFDFDKLPEAGLGWENEYSIGDLEWDLNHSEGIVSWLNGCFDGQIGWNYEWPLDQDCDKVPDGDGGQTGNDTPGNLNDTPTVTSDTLPQTGGAVLLAGALGSLALGTGLMVFRRR